MGENNTFYYYHEETHGEKLARKAKESPFMIIALTGLVSAVGFGAYTYKKRGAMSTSVFLMKFRVISQGIAVGALTAGMAYTLYNNHFNKPTVPKSNEH
nr:HIG1 domain family member 1A, mitochondrial-like [Plodia interpunctella]